MRKRAQKNQQNEHWLERRSSELRKAYMKVYHKAWYIKNKNRLLAKTKKYTIEHYTEVKRYKDQWYRDNLMDRKNKSRNRYYKLKDTTIRDKVLYKLYGITQQDYSLLLNSQNGVCAICKKLPSILRRLDVDHNHETRKVRGLLCSPCNQGIGLFKEDISLLQRAEIYLKKDQDYGY